MGKYVALLRGVNVGGKNIISMPELRVAFSEAGLYDVQSYINSGNIIFSDDSILEENAIAAKCGAIIADRFNLNISLTILPAQELTEAVCNAPKWWDASPDSKHNAIFVIAPATAEQVIHQVGEPKPEFEQLDFYKNTIFWSAPIKTFSRTRWSKIMASSVYDFVN